MNCLSDKIQIVGGLDAHLSLDRLELELGGSDAQLSLDVDPSVGLKKSNYRAVLLANNFNQSLPLLGTHLQHFVSLHFDLGCDCPIRFWTGEKSINDANRDRLATSMRCLHKQAIPLANRLPMQRGHPYFNIAARGASPTDPYPP